jgi:hypothetical protein
MKSIGFTLKVWFISIPLGAIFWIVSNEMQDAHAFLRSDFMSMISIFFSFSLFAYAFSIPALITTGIINYFIFMQSIPTVVKKTLIVFSTALIVMVSIYLTIDLIDGHPPDFSGYPTGISIYLDLALPFAIAAMIIILLLKTRQHEVKQDKYQA